MPKDSSLKRKKEIDQLFQKARRVHTPNFTLFYLNAPKNKFVFIAPKKYFKTATERNYIKRLMREILRKSVLANLTSTKSYALMCRTSLKILKEKQGFQSISNELLDLFTKLK